MRGPVSRLMADPGMSRHIAACVRIFCREYDITYRSVAQFFHSAHHYPSSSVRASRCRPNLSQSQLDDELAYNLSLLEDEAPNGSSLVRSYGTSTLNPRANIFHPRPCIPVAVAPLLPATEKDIEYGGISVTKQVTVEGLQTLFMQCDDQWKRLRQQATVPTVLPRYLPSVSSAPPEIDEVTKHCDELGSGSWQVLHCSALGDNLGSNKIQYRNRIFRVWQSSVHVRNHHTNIVNYVDLYGAVRRSVWQLLVLFNWKLVQVGGSVHVRNNHTNIVHYVDVYGTVRRSIWRLLVMLSWKLVHLGVALSSSSDANSVIQCGVCLQGSDEWDVNNIHTIFCHGSGCSTIFCPTCTSQGHRMCLSCVENDVVEESSTSDSDEYESDDSEGDMS